MKALRVPLSHRRGPAVLLLAGLVACSLLALFLWSLSSAAPARAGGLERGVQQQTTNLAAEKAVDKSIVRPGEALEYTVTVTNTSNISATTVTITDTLPGNFVFDSWDSPSADVIETQESPPGSIAWNVTGGLDGGESVSITISGSVDNTAVDGDEVENTVEVATGAPEADITDNVATAISTVSTQTIPDLGVVKLVNGKSSLAPHELEEITYTVQVTNTSSIPATGVLVNDIFPTGVSPVDVQATIGTYSSGVWTIGNLAGNTGATLTVTANVNDNTAGQTITNQAQLDSRVADSDPDNNQSSATINSQDVTGLTVTVVDASDTTIQVEGATVKLVDSADNEFTGVTGTNGVVTFLSTSEKDIAAGPAELTVSKPGFYDAKTVNITLEDAKVGTREVQLDTVNLTVFKVDNKSSAVNPGDTIDYTITVENEGTIAAKTVLITDTLPSNFTFTSIITNTTTTRNLVRELQDTANNRYRWRLVGELDKDANFSFIVRGTVKSGTPASSSLLNTVTVGTTSPEADRDNTDTETTPVAAAAPSLTVEKTVRPTEQRPGSSFNFTIRVTNNGNSTVTLTSISDTLSSYLENITAQTTQGTATVNSTSRTVTVSGVSLDSGEAVTVVINARVSASTTTTVNLTNTATASYSGGSRQASVAYRIVGTSTLPPTGFGPPQAGRFSLSLDTDGTRLAGQPHPRWAQDAAAPHAPASDRAQQVAGLALAFALLLGGLGAAALAYAARSRARSPEWAGYLTRMGTAFVVIGLLFGLAAAGLKAYAGRPAPVAVLEPTQTNSPAQPAIAALEVWLPPSVPENDLPSLPDFAIPTPAVTATPQGEALDTSPVQRIQIPSIGVNNEVKFVPFDGYTWMISGLRQEVAWLGDTSWPGLGSNTSLAAHVTLRGGELGPFRYLDQLIPGDIVRVQTAESVYTYKVREKRTVPETDFSVVAKTETPQLTLITCTGWDQSVSFYVQRTVVFADLIEVIPWLDKAAN